MFTCFASFPIINFSIFFCLIGCFVSGVIHDLGFSLVLIFQLQLKLFCYLSVYLISLMFFVGDTFTSARLFHTSRCTLLCWYAFFQFEGSVMTVYREGSVMAPLG